MSALLKEVAEVLAAQGDLTCVPSVETTDDGVVVTVLVPVEGQDTTTHALRALELFHALQYLQDLAQLRSIADKYDIDAAALEALLPKGETT